MLGKSGLDIQTDSMLVWEEYLGLVFQDFKITDFIRSFIMQMYLDEGWSHTYREMNYLNKMLQP